MAETRDALIAMAEVESDLPSAAQVALAELAVTEAWGETLASRLVDRDDVPQEAARLMAERYPHLYGLYLSRHDADVADVAVLLEGGHTDILTTIACRTPRRDVLGLLATSSAVEVLMLVAANGDAPLEVAASALEGATARAARFASRAEADQVGPRDATAPSSYRDPMIPDSDLDVHLQHLEAASAGEAAADGLVRPIGEHHDAYWWLAHGWCAGPEGGHEHMTPQAVDDGWGRSTGPEEGHPHVIPQVVVDQWSRSTTDLHALEAALSWRPDLTDAGGMAWSSNSGGGMAWYTNSGGVLVVARIVELVLAPLPDGIGDLADAPAVLEEVLRVCASVDTRDAFASELWRRGITVRGQNPRVALTDRDETAEHEWRPRRRRGHFKPARRRVWRTARRDAVKDAQVAAALAEAFADLLGDDVDRWRLLADIGDRLDGTVEEVAVIVTGMTWPT